MNIVGGRDVARADWNQLCDQSDEAWLFHRREWVEIESRHFVGADHSFALASAGRLHAICPLYVSDGRTGTNGERLLHTGIHRHTGIALRPGLPPGDVKAAQSVAMRQILRIGEDEDVDRIQLNSHNLAPANMGLDRAEIPFWVESHGFELGLAFGPYSMQPGPGMATCNADQIIDLLRDEELLFGSLEESCRRAVRRAASFGLTVESLSGDGSVERYYRLAQLSATRTGEALAPFQYYADVWEAFSHIGESRILAVERNGELIAAILLLVYKHAVSFLGGVSDPDALSMRVNDFAHWSAMVWAKHEGLRWYRLGPWFPTVDPDWTIAKVSRFKKKFGGNSRTIIQGSLFRRPERYRAEAHGLVDLNCSRSHR